MHCASSHRHKPYSSIGRVPSVWIFCHRLGWSLSKSSLLPVSILFHCLYYCGTLPNNQRNAIARFPTRRSGFSAFVTTVCARFPLALIACHIESSQFSSSRKIYGWMALTEAISSYQFSFEDWAGCCILGKLLGLRLVTLGSARLGRERPEHWWQGACRAGFEVAWPKSGLNWLNCCR